jgi:hypothetical protein
MSITARSYILNVKFFPLFCSMLNSTFWSYPPFVKNTFLTLALLADKNGFVEISRHALASRAYDTLAHINEALDTLTSLQPNTQDPTAIDVLVLIVPRGFLVPLCPQVLETLRMDNLTRAAIRMRRKKLRDQAKSVNLGKIESNIETTQTDKAAIAAPVPTSCLEGPLPEIGEPDPRNDEPEHMEPW